MRGTIQAAAAALALTTTPATASDLCGSGWFPDQLFRGLDEVRTVAGVDLDGSGRTDLIMLNANGGAQVFLADGLIGFAPAVVYDVGVGRWSLLVGDLDGDDITDIGATSLGLTDFVVWTGVGDGTFENRTVIELNRDSTNAVLADVDQNGLLDLVATERNEERVNVYLNQGGLTFAAPLTVQLAAGARPNALTVANVVGNAALDLIVTRDTADLVEIRAGVGNGSFGASVLRAVGERPLGVIACDLSGNGDLDLAVTGNDSNQVTVLLNNNGVFTSTVNYEVSFDPWAISAGDVDGDGDKDLVVAHVGFFDALRILFNDGTGAFPDQTAFSQPEDTVGIVLDDLDGNGTTDFALADSIGHPTVDRGTLNIKYNRGDATFPTLLDSYGTPDQPVDLELGHLNPDGFLDVVGITQSGVVFRRLGAADGRFGPQGLVGDFVTPGADVIARDIDGDLDLDLAFTSGFFYTRRNNGVGGFAADQMIDAGTGLGPLRAADLDGDDDVDFLSSSFNLERLVLFINNGVSGFAPTFIPLDDSPTGIEIADIDGDDDPDLVVGLDDQTILVFDNTDGRGDFAPGVPIPSRGNPREIRAGQLNDDEHIDLAFAYAINTSVPQGFAAWASDGESGFVEIWHVETDNDPRDLHIVDMDGDGDQDLMLGLGDSWPNLNTATFYLNDGDTFLAGAGVEVSGRGGVGVWGWGSRGGWRSGRRGDDVRGRDPRRQERVHVAALPRGPDPQ